MPRMPFVVDDSAIDAWVRLYKASWKTPSVAIWVAVPSLDRLERAREVSDALGPRPHTIHGPSGKVLWGWTVYPTDQGTFIWIPDTAEWRPLVDRLVVALDRRGHSGAITCPPQPPVLKVPAPETPVPGALLAFCIEPDFEHGPLNMWGRPAARWGVPEKRTQRLVHDAVGWSATGRHLGLVNKSGPPIAVSPADAVDVTTQQLNEEWHNVHCTFLDESEETSAGRTAAFSSWGQVAFIELGSQPRGEAQRVDELAALLTTYASNVEVGAIRLVRPGAPTWSLQASSGMWMNNRHLWSSHVYDAQGIQLLTSKHLNNARDLSAWHVAEAAPERYLVQANDLDAWFAPPDTQSWAQGRFPAEGTLAQARADFGNMILTPEIAAANPPRISPS